MACEAIREASKRTTLFGRPGGASMATFSRRQLAQRAMLTEADLVEVGRCRQGYTRCGFAYQLGFAKLLGRLPKQEPLELVPELATFIGLQCEEDPQGLAEYEKSRRTIVEHQERVREHLGLRRLGPAELAMLESFIFECACQLDHAAGLQAKAKEFLREQKILLPAESKLVRLVGEHRERARQKIFENIASGLPEHLTQQLDELLIVDEHRSVSRLQVIKENPSNPSAEAMESLVSKLATIKATGVLSVDVSWLSRNYQRALFHYARRGAVHRLRRLARARRHATLVCFLWQSYGDAIDQIVDMFDKLITRAMAQAQKKLDERMIKQRALLKDSLAALRAIGGVLLDDSVTDADVRSALFEKVPREVIAAYVEGAEEWVAGRSSDPFVEFMNSRLRRFATNFLKDLDLQDSSAAGQSSCLEAVAILKALNEERRRSLPDDVTTAFVPKRLHRFVLRDGKINKRAWECALLLRLKNEIRAGNVWVRGSKRFGHLDDFFMPRERWEAQRAEFFARAGLPSDPRQVPDYLGHRLGKAFDRFLEGAPANEYAKVDEDGWHVSVDPATFVDSEKVERLKTWLGHKIRRINLPDLLIEVDNELAFTRHFFAPGQRGAPSTDDICVTLLALLAHGCNLGSHKMSELTRGISYSQLKRVSDWQLTQEAHRSALATIAQGISALDTAAYWGDGRTSASDGQRFALPRKVLQQTYSTKFSDFALEFYSFVADNYAPFYSTPIECTDRDAAFVLDGLLYNETELELEEHYTDTHGYTELNFAAFGMLGRRFCPRIRGVKEQRIYRIDRERSYGALDALVGRADRTIDTQVIVEQWDRLGHLYASLEAGHATASVVLKRLAGYSSSNRFYRASRDLGRIFKTEFILEYMSQPELRSRVRRGLLKVEQLHALARDVFYARRGRINRREVWEQMNSCSSLTLLVACIVYWQAREMSRAARQVEPDANVDLSMLKHVSPIEWDNVVIYGQYRLNRGRIRRGQAEDSDKQLSF
jgi:TnpA family transposase